MQDQLTNLLFANIPSLLLVLGWLALMRYLSRTGWSLAIVGLIGTTLHEAAHYLVGLLLGAKPVSVSLWPKRQGDHWVLGSVGFNQLNIWNSAFVAMAPLLLLALAILTFSFITGPAFITGSLGTWLLSGYVIACCLSSCWPSSTDFRVGGLSLAMYSAAGYLCYLLSR